MERKEGRWSHPNVPTTVEEARAAEKLEAEARRLGIPSWQLEMSRAVPTELVQAIVADNRRGQELKPLSEQVAQRPREEVAQKPRGTGFVDPRPLEPPPGIEHIDRIASHFERLERAELARRLGVDDLKARAAKPEKP
jgi:hypothetical protein